MTPQNYKTAGIVCFILCAICLFVAWERYNANASTVNAINNFAGTIGGPNSPFGGSNSPFGQIKPATPAATTYGIFFGVLFAIGGAYCLAQSRPKP